MPLHCGTLKGDTRQGLLRLSGLSWLYPYFANVGRVTARIERLLGPDVRAVVIDASAIPDIETTAALRLAGFEQRLARRGVTLWFAAPTPGAEAMLAAALSETGRQRIHPTVSAALEGLPSPEAQTRLEGKIAQTDP